MNPQMMQQAQQMMANMSPEQMESMQRMVADMPPDQRARMQAMAMGGMGGAGAPPMASAQPRAPGSGGPELSSATALKNEGNDLHKAGKYREAVAKYEEAQRKLQAASSSEAKGLRQMCMLNTAMCFLKLEDWQPCLDICTKVLDSGPNLKAYYRRGQALMGQLQWHDAILDLKRALTLCPDGDAQRDLIATKLSVARAHQPCNESTDLSDDDSVRAGSPPVPRRNDGSVVIEDVTDAPAASSTARSGGAVSGAAGGAPASFTAQSAEQMTRMMQDNPAHIEQMVAAMDAMSDEEFQQHVRQQGLPNVDRAAMKQAMGMFTGMSPEQARTFSEMASSMQRSGGGAGTSGTSATRAPPTGDAGAVAGAGASPAGAMDPAVMAQMMQGMTPEQMASTTEAARASGALPPGMNISPEMMKSGMEMMKNMKPEDMQRMQQMAAGGGGGIAAGAGGTPDISAMLSNPEMMQQSMKMMQDMGEDDLVAMLKSSKPDMSDASARKMAQSMKAIDPDSRWIKGLMGAASVAGRGMQGAKSAQHYLRQNPILLAAVVLVIVAVALKMFGVI